MQQLAHILLLWLSLVCSPSSGLSAAIDYIFALAFLASLCILALFHFQTPGKELKAIEIELHCCCSWRDFAISFALPWSWSVLEAILNVWSGAGLTLCRRVCVPMCAVHTDKLQKEKPKKVKLLLASLPLMKIGSCWFSSKRQINKPNMATAWPKACATAVRQKYSQALTTATILATYKHTESHLKWGTKTHIENALAPSCWLLHLLLRHYFADPLTMTDPTW